MATTIKQFINYQLRKHAKNLLFLEAQKEITERIWNLYPDQNGILRIKDRLQQIGLDNQLIYLPKEHRIILTLVLDAHEKCCHLGTAATLTKFRTEFWIEHGPTTVRKIIECRREITRGFALPGMAPLPSSPVTDISTSSVRLYRSLLS